MKDDTLYIVAPAYNETENIVDFVNDWYKVIESRHDAGSRLVVVDDGSKDNTYEILQNLSGCKPKLIPLTKKRWSWVYCIVCI